MLKSDEIEIKNLLKDYESRHSDFQIEHFIIGSQGDLWGRYKQCLRELASRYDSIKKNELKMRSVEERFKKSLRFKIWKIVTGNDINGLNQKNKVLDNIKSELDCLLKIAKNLKEEIGELTEEKRYQLETKSWAAKGLKMAAIDIMASGRISNQTYDFLFALPKDSMVDIIRQLSSKKPMELLGFEPEKIK